MAEVFQLIAVNTSLNEQVFFHLDSSLLDLRSLAVDILSDHVDQSTGVVCADAGG